MAQRAPPVPAYGEELAARWRVLPSVTVPENIFHREHRCPPEQSGTPVLKVRPPNELDAAKPTHGVRTCVYLTAATAFGLRASPALLGERGLSIVVFFYSQWSQLSPRRSLGVCVRVPNERRIRWCPAGRGYPFCASPELSCVLVRASVMTRMFLGLGAAVRNLTREGCYAARWGEEDREENRNASDPPPPLPGTWPECFTVVCSLENGRDFL